MTTSEIPHHRHRYPQGDLPPLATPGKTTPQTAPSFWARRLAEVVAGFCLLLDLLASATSPSDAAHIAVQTDRLPRLSAMPRPQGDRWDCSSAEPILAPLGAERDSGQDQVSHVFSPADHRSQDTPGPRAGRNPGRARSARA